jgi:hypothetical protein
VAKIRIAEKYKKKLNFSFYWGIIVDQRGGKDEDKIVDDLFECDLIGLLFVSRAIIGYFFKER